MLDDKDFWEEWQQDSSEFKAGLNKTETDITSIPVYRYEEKTTKNYPHEERDPDIEAMLADIRMTAVNKEPGLPADETTVNAADDRVLFREMLSAMQALTEEVKQLRTQIGANPYNVSDHPRGVTDSEGSSSNSAPAAYSSETASHIDTMSEGTDQKQQGKKKKNKVLSIISSIVFYLVIIATVFGAFLMRSTGEGRPFMLAGYSAATVLTGSMEDVYPRGSLIIIKSVDPKELKIEDDITFMVSEKSSITHRIIGISNTSNGLTFETKGTMNKNPDKDPVAESNVVGKVIFHSKALGDFANFIKKNWMFLLFVIIVLIGLITFLKWNAGKSYEEEESQHEENTDKKEKEEKKDKENRLVSHLKRQIKFREDNENQGGEGL